MPSRRTQKQVAEKYKGNLSYFKKPHYFRTLRFYVTAAALVGTAAAILYHFQSGTDAFYSPGPLSQQHQHLQENCQSCHDQKRLADLAIKPGAFHEALKETTAPKLAEAVSNSAHEALRGVEYSKIDNACLRCHEGHDLHQPDKATIALSHFRSDIVVAHAGACSVCHREHTGPGSMKLPGTSDCLACHSDANRMNATRMRLDIAREDSTPNQSGIVRTIDSAAHFIPPELPVRDRQAAPAVFTSFSGDHPKFGYERPGLRDPNPLKFNHQRHFENDIPKVNGKKLDCNYCHKPVSDGAFYGRISYETNCKACHSLQFDPLNPELEIPHGNPEGVRAFLRTLPFQYSNIAAKRGITSQKEVAAFTNQQLLALRDRIRSGEDFEKQIFFTANPYKGTRPNEIASAGSRAIFPGCAYCHEVTPISNGGAEIAPPIFVDRWLEHGRFTHATHTHISCVECHDAKQSRETADILLPAKASCAECHRSLETTPAQAAKFPVHNAGLSIAAQQRRDGRAPSDCLTCHTFHGPNQTNGGAEAESRLKELLKSANAKP